LNNIFREKILKFSDQQFLKKKNEATVFSQKNFRTKIPKLKKNAKLRKKNPGTKTNGIISCENAYTPFLAVRMMKKYNKLNYKRSICSKD